MVFIWGLCLVVDKIIDNIACGVHLFYLRILPF